MIKMETLLKHFDSYSLLSTSKRIDGMDAKTKKFVLFYLMDYLKSATEFNKDSLINYLLNKKLAYSTKASIAISIGKFMKFMGLINADDFILIKQSFRQPKKDWSSKTMSIEMINNMILESMKSPGKFTRIRNPLILTIFATLGARLSQVVSLDKEDVSFKDNSIHIILTKKKERLDTLRAGKDIKQVPNDLILANTKVINLFDNYMNAREKINGSPALFLNRSKQRIGQEYIRAKLIKRIATKLNYNVTSHTFRHFVATQVANSCGIHQSAILLGHADIKTTMNYINPETIDTSALIKKIYHQEEPKEKKLNWSIADIYKGV
ncbi:MAG: site-specific integrase [Nanoarchaeota archaeon]|nr:site-specific integrase [Nanoarchaeota archaeon]